MGPVKLLLDTCTLIWLVAEPGQLSLKIASLINEGETDLFVSDCSVWEICLKWQAGKLRLPAPPRSWVEEQRRIWKFNYLPIERVHLFRGTELPDHHRDPFDRLLVAQAIENEMTIGTPDMNIMKYPVATVW